MKWCMLTKQIPAEKCSHRKTSSSREGKEGFRNRRPSLCLCIYPVMPASKNYFNFLVLGIILLILPLTTQQIIRFSPKLWDYVMLNLLYSHGFLSFSWYLVEYNYCVETVHNSLIFFFGGLGSPFLNISNIFFIFVPDFLYWALFSIRVRNNSVMIEFFTEWCQAKKVMVRESECTFFPGPLQWSLHSHLFELFVGKVVVKKHVSCQHHRNASMLPFFTVTYL